MHITHFVRNGELNTAYHEAGAGEPLLLIHGFTGSKLDFHDELGGLADLRRLIAFDQRGHGETSNQRPYTLDVLVADLFGLLDVLEIDRCDLLGHSMGGMVALRAVLERPERFRSLILMDTSAAPLTLWPSSARQQMVTLVRERGCTALLDAMRQADPTASQQRGIDRLGEAEHWRRITVKLEQLDPEAFADLGDALADCPSLTGRLGEIGCPTSVLVGEQDAPFIAPSRTLAEGIPGAGLVIVPAAGHSPQYENEPAWRDAVRDHLERGHR